MKPIFRLVIVLFLINIGGTFAYSCSCANPSLRQRFRSANSVFVGEVIEFKVLLDDSAPEELSFMPYLVTFKVEKQWKGKKLKQIEAFASYDIPGMCNDLDLGVGKRILVFANKNSGHLTIGGDCGPNRDAEHATKEIKKLSSFFFRTYSSLYPYPRF